MLIAEYRHYSETTPITGDDWLSAFGRWLERAGQLHQIDEHDGVAEKETMIGMYLVSLNNLTRSRFNRLVNELPLSSIMDYQFLVLLRSHGRQTKSELIAINHMEMSSGIEVIRRLIRNGWITEAPNPHDRRSKHVAITDAGRALVDQLQPQVDTFYRSLCTDLDAGEKTEVLGTLELLLRKI